MHDFEIVDQCDVALLPLNVVHTVIADIDHGLEIRGVDQGVVAKH